MIISTVLPIFQLLLAIGNLCIMLYALKTFLLKPHDTLEQRVDNLEDEIKEVKNNLLNGQIKCEEQKDALTVVIHSILALIEWEMEYCLTEHKTPSDGLINAKNHLQSYLAGK